MIFMHFKADPIKETLVAEVCLFVLRREKECVERAEHCDRKCQNCNLVLSPDTILYGYKEAIRIVEQYKDIVKQGAA